MGERKVRAEGWKGGRWKEFWNGLKDARVLGMVREVKGWIEGVC